MAVPPLGNKDITTLQWPFQERNGGSKIAYRRPHIIRICPLIGISSCAAMETLRRRHPEEYAPITLSPRLRHVIIDKAGRLL